MRKRKYIPTVSLILMFILNYPIYILWVKGVTVGRDIAIIGVNQGDLIKVEYNHSMYKVRQKEVFLIGDNFNFYLESVEFGSYAAAIYYYDNGHKEYIDLYNGNWKIMGDKKNYLILKYWVSPATGHIIEIKDLRINLSDVCRNSEELIEIFLNKY